MKAIIILVKAFVLWITILLSSILATTVLALPTESVIDGPLSGGQAFLLVNAIHALMLTIVAQNSSVRGLRLALLIGVTLFAIQSFLLLLEAFYFIDDLKIGQSILLLNSAMVLIVSIFTAVVSLMLWRKKPLLHQQKLSVKNLKLRILAISIMYVLAYFIAGYYIAWASKDVQAFYSFGQDIRLLPLLLFQLFRGALWGLLAWFMVTSLSGSYIKRCLIIASAFSVLAVAQLVYPNIYMQWEVRLIHMIEVGTSNFVFGGMAAMMLVYKKKELAP